MIFSVNIINIIYLYLKDYNVFLPIILYKNKF